MIKQRLQNMHVKTYWFSKFVWPHHLEFSRVMYLITLMSRIKRNALLNSKNKIYNNHFLVTKKEEQKTNA